MDRLCKVGDVIKCSKFFYYPPRKNNVYHMSDLPLDYADGNEWLVISVQMNGGGNGHGAHDVYPDGHEVTIQMLPYGSKIPNNDYTIKFYQTGCFRNMIDPSEIELVKELKLKVEFSWQED